MDTVYCNMASSGLQVLAGLWYGRNTTLYIGGNTCEKGLAHAERVETGVSAVGGGGDHRAACSAHERKIKITFFQKNFCPSGVFESWKRPQTLIE